MKRGLTALCLAVFAGFTGPAAHSEDADRPTPIARIRVDVQMVSIPIAEAGRLIPAFENRETANDAWTRLQAMITNGEATLIGWPILWLRSGQRGVFESIGEDRYPTEFTPPQAAGESSFGQGKIRPTRIPFSPTAFETRNTGCTLEANASVEKDGKVITLDIVAQFVRRIATREWRIRADAIGSIGVLQQPDFLTSKVTTSLHVRHEKPILIGTFVVAEPQPHVELFILHTKATQLPAVTFPSLYFK